MFDRSVNIPKSKSFFLFGARGTGKSTLLRQRFLKSQVYLLDLLLPSVEERFARDPELLLGELKKLPPDIDTVILDEVQKVPKLLDVVHHYLENNPPKYRFVLTGSSGRKLKKGSANLLAGRAFVRDLFPLVWEELDGSIETETAMAWGTLPFVTALNDDEEKLDYLISYVRTYISEEIQREQIVRNLDPFRKFIEVAAQLNGKIINNSNIASGIGVDPKTVGSYYTILEDTLLGHLVLPFSLSFRKRLVKSPKFYFFDTGVCRAMGRTLSVALTPGTSLYGEVFEQLIVTQVIHTLRYHAPEAKVSFYKDENDIEVDLVIEIPGQTIKFIEIKSSKNCAESLAKNLKIVRRDWPNAQFELWSQDKIHRDIDNISAIYWVDGLNQLRRSLEK